MRVGQNPAKHGLSAYKPKPLVVALLTFIPNEEGYFKQIYEVLLYQIASLHASTSNFDLVVFDNGSSFEIKERLVNLQKQGLVHSLYLSKYNLGKVAAINWILSSQQDHEWICFSDGDMFFRPGWFEDCKGIFQAFPQAGLVFAKPSLFDVLHGKGKADQILINDPRYKIERKQMPQDVIAEYARGYGLTPDQENGYKDNLYKIVEDVNSGTKSLINASHNQFLTTREAAKKIFPLDTKLGFSMMKGSDFNSKVDDLGLLQLSTLFPYTFHMGNSIDDWTRQEINRLKLDNILGEKQPLPSNIQEASDKSKKQKAIPFLKTLAKNRFMSNILRRIYNALFEFYAS
jgi:glycosyltransferase involved in cell wall biosynthesis